MILVVALVLILSASFSANASAQSAPTDQPDTAEVRRLEESLIEALHARDRQRMEPLLAADYVLRGAPDIDRETWIHNAVTLCWGERSDIADFRATPYPDVVITSFELTFYVNPSNCSAGVLRSLITDIWVREADGWKLKIRHTAAPPASGDGIAVQFGVEPAPPPRWEASSEFSAVATGGNTSTRTLGLGAQLTHRGNARRTDLHTRFLTSQADDVTNARLFEFDGRQSFTVTDRLQMFGEARYMRDRFAGIDDRATATGGLAYAVPLPPTQSLSLEAGLGLTAEQRLDLAHLRFATATGAMVYTWTIASRTELRDEASINADLQSSDNWRGANTASLNVSINSMLSLRASHGFEYRNRPVVGFGRSDMRTAIALVCSFQKAAN